MTNIGVTVRQPINLKINHSGGGSSDVPNATFSVPGKVRRTVYNVKDFGALGDGTTDDVIAIQAAMDAAGPTGGTVLFPPGRYMVSNRLYWDKRTSTNSVLGPTLKGSEGIAGPSPDFQQLGVVEIMCTSSFPLGEYIIDYLGPTAQDRAICGFKISGFVINCNSRGAGIRMFNWFSGILSDMIIGNNPKAPNPSIAGAFASPTSNTGAVQSNGSPTQNTFYNMIERVFVQECATDGFVLGNAGGYDFMDKCFASNCGRFGYNIIDKVTLVSCIAQGNAKTTGLHGADYNIGRYNVTMIGCTSFSGKPWFGNGVKVSGGSSAVSKCIGCVFYGAINSDLSLTEADAAIVQIQENLHNIEFIGCHFITGNSTNTSDFVYLHGSATGRVIFSGCHFITEQGSALTNVPINTNGNESVLSLTNCHGINPLNSKSWGDITNAVQTLEIGISGGVPSGGTFTLTFNGQTTGPIAYNATAATIQTALLALSSIGSGNVACTGTNINSRPVRVVFQAALGNAAQPAITANGAGLTPAGAVTITTILPGGPNVTLNRKEGRLHRLVLTGSISPVLTSGLIIGDDLVLEITQDAVGGRTITWPANAKFGSGGAIIPAQAAAEVTVVTFLWDGTNWQEQSKNNGNIKVVSLTTTQRDAMTAVNGMLIYNTTANRFEKYENGAWAATSGAAGGDMFGPASSTDNAIVRFDGAGGKTAQNSAATIDDSGNIAANNLSGTNTGDQNLSALFNLSTDDMDDIVDGVTYKKYSQTEKTKLAGVETLADVTDAANVTAAGAFMKSTDDLDDIADGTTNKGFTSTEKTKLAGVEALADVTDTANVTSSGALMDSEVTSLSGVKSLTLPDNTTISAFGKTLVDDADAATARATLSVVIGTNVQAWDADLDAVAALSPSNDDVLQRKAGAWTNRTMAQVKTDLALVKGDVGLGNVDNTSNATERAATRTVSNMRVTKRVGSTASSATPTINTDNVDMYIITALAAAITSFTSNLSGTPTDGQTLWISITDNGTARAITWGASFEASTVALPTTTVISTRLDVGFIWNAATSKWRCVAVA